MHETNLNSELLSADARGRKSVPFAVFAVIFIHIVLFLVLLIAAGCRAKARAKRNAAHQQELAAASTLTSPLPNSTTVSTPSAQTNAPAEPVLATEPPTEALKPAASETATLTKKPTIQSRPTASVSRGLHLHTVQQGETVGKIAHQYNMTVQEIRAENKLKTDMIRVGQKLRVSTDKPQKKQAFAAL